MGKGNSMVVSYNLTIFYKLNEQNQVYCFGDNEFNKVSDGDEQFIHKNVRNMKFSSFDSGVKVLISKIFAGYNHCFAFSVSGNIFAWGNCGSARLTKDYGTEQQKQPKLINLNFKSIAQKDKDDENNEDSENNQAGADKPEEKENIDERKIISLINQEGSIRNFNELMVFLY